MARKWLPFAPAGTPGVWFHVNHMIPTRSGAYYPGNIFETVVGAGPASPGTTLRAWCALLPADTVVGYVGSTTKLYTYDGATTFTDVSKGGGYTNTATDWSFAQYGNITLATNRVDNLQSRDASGAGAFADAAGSPPKARIVVTQAEQVLLFDLNDGAEKPDAFASCAPGDYTDWSGAGATTPTRIRHRPGGIRAAIAFRDYVLSFKRNSVYKHTYTGNTHKWKTELIAIGRGAWGKHDVVNCGDFVIFSGPGGAWKYDGASFTSITDYYGEVNGGAAASAGFFAPLSANVFLQYSGAPDAYAYNVVSDTWGHFAMGRASASMGSNFVAFSGEPAALQLFTANTSATPDMMWAVNLSANPSVLKASLAWGGGSQGSIASLYGGIEGQGGVQITNFGGVDVDYTESRQLIPVAESLPGDTELRLDIYTGSSKDARSLNPFASGTTPNQSDVSSSTAQRRFDFQVSAVYARFRLKMPDSSGRTEINDYTPRMAPDGEL